MSVPFNTKIAQIQQKLGNVLIDGKAWYGFDANGKEVLGETWQALYDEKFPSQPPPAGAVSGPTGKPIVIDIYHGDFPLDLQKLKDAGVVEINAKCTTGTKHLDSAWLSTKKWCLDNGMKLSGYHWPTGENESEQVDFFLNNLGGLSGDLDWEKNELNGQPLPGGDMKLAGVRRFVLEYQLATDEKPLLYMGGYGKDEMNGQPDEVLNSCDLWLAQYGPHPVLPPGFTKLKMWQFTDKFKIPGLSHNFDASEIYNIL